MTTGNPDYTQNVKIIGKDPSGNPVAVALDASGNIIALMKGEYAGAQKTLATDEDGRILAIITDPENIWGIRPAIGNAELAARLGSPMTYERRGQVLFMDSFEAGMSKWTVERLGTGGTVALSADTAEHGHYAVKITTRAGETQFLYIRKRIPYVGTLSRIGIEAHVRPDANTTEILLALAVWDGTQQTVWELSWKSDGTIWYDSPACGNLINSGFNTAYRYDPTLFHALKMVVDVVHGTYLRLYIDADKHDMSSLNPCLITDSAAPMISAATGAIGATLNSSEVLVDSVVVTTAEPET